MLLQSLLRPVLTPLMRGMFDAPIASSSAWSPLSLWPDGIATPGMWISPRDLTSQWQDYAGTTPVATPGTVADTSNPVGLALDIRAGAPDVLGPELVTNGTFDSGISGWTAYYLSPTLSWDSGNHRIAVTGNTWCTATTPFSVTAGKTYLLSATLAGTDPAIWFGTNGSTTVGERLLASGQSIYTAASSGTLYAVIQGCGPDGSTAYFDNISVREVPGNHMLQSTSAARPLMSAYDGQTLGPGDTYDATGFPIAQLYDGVDDGMATAAFTAGTLIDGMDCMIVVRRDSVASLIAGLYKSAGDGSKYFGEAWSGLTHTCFSGVGTPTVWVDNTQLAGGTAVNVGTLSNALTVGDWHILEFRDLDLSAWTALAFGGFGGAYNFNGGRGDILLYPSSASTEDKDAARQYLADYYGVTLP
jgi:hypothetical protein